MKSVALILFSSHHLLEEKISKCYDSRVFDMDRMVMAGGHGQSIF